MLALEALSQPGAAQPQEPDQATVEAARELGRAGLAMYDKGDCKGALEKFRQAYALYKAPTIGLLAARCEAKLGRPAAATTLYLEVEQTDLGASPTPVFQQARRDAARERKQIQARVPQLIIVVEPRDGAIDDGGALGVPSTQPTPPATVVLDGALVPREEIGKPKLVEVGAHEVKGQRGNAAATERVQLKEGERRKVVLRLDPAHPEKSGASQQQGSPEGGAGGAKAEGPGPGPQPDGPDEGAPGQTQRLIGWTALGVGAAGMVVGGVLGGVAAGQGGDLEPQCPDRVCAPVLQGDVDTYNTLRMASGVGLIGGAILAAAGGVLLWTAPSSAPAAPQGSGGVRVTPRVGWLAVGVEGTF